MEIVNNKLTDYIEVFDNVLPDETNLKFYKFLKYEDHRFEKAKVQEADGVPDQVRKDKRNSSLWWPRQINCSMSECHWTSLLGNASKKLYFNYLKKMSLPLDFNMSELSFLKYEEGGHYNTFHVDQGKVNRSLSLVFWVNSNFEGGDFKFKNPSNDVEIEIEKKANRAIVFPSNFLFPHKVLPVEKGVRYSVVSWAQ
jgi:predicted 2-oxoglutarate/Fe(II)-dependent dioxygenase YbiX|tara:strand:+ start:1960 stop:2550 length:591 start_codon:yes stop_codon:yes gene_type:complete